MDDRTNVSRPRFSFVRWYIREKAVSFFQTFQLISPTGLLPVAREWKRVRRKRDFMIFANLSEEAQLHFLRKNVFGFVRNFIIQGAQIRDISFVKSMTNGLNKYAIGRIKVRWNRFDLALSYKRDIRMVTMATGGASLRLLPIRNVDGRLTISP